MKKQELIETLKEMGLDANTASFYVDENGEDQSDTCFDTCEISGIKGDCAGVTMLDADGNVRHLYVGTWLINGPLGKLAGAF